MDLVRTTAPTRSEILAFITVPAVKAAKRIAHDLEDQLIAEFVVDAFQFFDGPDGWLRRAVLPQAWTYYRPAFSDEMEIPVPPLASVEAVKYRDAAGALQTLAPTNYEVIDGTFFGKIVLAADGAWPTTKTMQRAVEIQFRAGWAADEVPGPVRRSIMLLAGSLYEHREADFEDTRVSFVSRKIEYGIEKLAGRFRILNDLYDVFAV
ncbi:hypothetical protein [uncultured Alsobacter sp.]|uniref:head-tail connector protein n=1 Tax=uncultured Alsobacter sp. TaxID=1748258 RepID=UPI0025D595D1|nr:hypothetical protein [uncultured Alsobacter sp.]